MPSWIRAGQRFTYQLAGPEASGRCTFTILEAEDELGFRWVMGDEEGEVRVTESALRSAQRRLLFTPTGCTTDDFKPINRPQTACLPPFLLSRDALAQRSAGKAFRTNLEWTDPPSAQLEPAGVEALEVAVAGQRRKLRALKARGQGATLWVLEDPVWPLVLRREEAGGSWALTEIAAA